LLETTKRLQKGQNSEKHVQNSSPGEGIICNSGTRHVVRAAPKPKFLFLWEYYRNEDYESKKSVLGSIPEENDFYKSKRKNERSDQSCLFRRRDYEKAITFKNCPGF
jgi:hypothetical protein